MSDDVRLIPLGGLGEVGMNCMAVEEGGRFLVVDCGVSFPTGDHGIDVYHPDFTFLTERADDVLGVFVTHGHEDHIGGLPYLLADLDVPVWGPPHAIELARRRLREHGFSETDVRMRAALPGESHRLGPFEIEPIRVAHSIVEACALRIVTGCGTILHTGDFRFDPDPPDGEPTDTARLREIGDEGTGLLLSDSTNVAARRPALSEREVGRALMQRIAPARGLVVVALFASNVQRLAMLGDIAGATGRRVCLLGRSLRTQVEVASAVGRLQWPTSLCVGPDQVAQLPRENVLVLAGGSQGEAQSSLRRLAAGVHPIVSVREGDTVILSSRIIPGNERRVTSMLADLLRTGARVHTRATDRDVHTSGHATSIDQRRMIDLVRPKAFLPIHGNLQHLLAHAGLARDAGVRSVLVVENGTSVRFDGITIEKGTDVPHGRIPVALGGEPLDGKVLERRIELGRAGVAVVSVATKRGCITRGPRVQTHGVPGVDENEEQLKAVARAVRRAYRRLAPARTTELDPRDELRRAARRQLERLSGTRPMVLIDVLDDD